MASLGAVLDTSVLYAAALRDTLLRAAEADLFRPLWSDEIMDELRRNLIADGRASARAAQRLIDEMNASFPEALASGYAHLPPNLANDPKDRHVLAVAIVSGAMDIVTLNLRDFPMHALAPFGVSARSPDDFLVDLFDLAPETMSIIVHEQAADLQWPPKSVHQLVAEIARQAPLFADRVRRSLA